MKNRKEVRVVMLGTRGISGGSVFFPNESTDNPFTVSVERPVECGA
jgi:hypothetical protein